MISTLSWSKTSCLGLLAAVVTGCSTSPPLISHAHVGHAVTAWRDTPGEEGLLKVARHKTDEALVSLDIKRQRRDKSIENRLTDIARAIDPERLKGSSSDNYGVLRALDGTIDHLEYAASTEDASANLAEVVAQITQIYPSVRSRFEASFDLATGRGEGSGLPPTERMTRLGTWLESAASGVDQNANGRIEMNREEAGLRQIEDALEQALLRETNPRYYPIGRKWLFALVRLPDGNWEFRSDGEVPDDMYNLTTY